jgi:hypothetical protein
VVSVALSHSVWPTSLQGAEYSALWNCTWQSRCTLTLAHSANTGGTLHEWVMSEAGNRLHGTTREQPLARFALERPLLAALPDVFCGSCGGQASILKPYPSASSA